MRWRRFLFLSLTSLFLILAPLIVLYAKGIKFDFEKKRFVVTGALYFKTFPKAAEIFINGKKTKITDPLLGTAQIKNLLPRTYFVEIKKEGYFEWKKEMKVKEGEVTLAKVILFPKNLNFYQTEIQKEKLKLEFPCKEIKKECKIEGDKIYFWNETEGNFEVVFEGLKGFDVFNKKIAVFSNHEIWLFDEKERKFLLRESGEIKDLVFLNDDYLAFLTKDKVKVLEINTEGGLNVYELKEVAGDTIFFEKGRLLICKENEKCLISSPLF